MHAVQSIKDDLVVKVEQLPEYQIHRFFYKGVPFRKIIWRPATYYRDEGDIYCNNCIGTHSCFVCEANWNSDALVPTESPLSPRITSYINGLFQLELPEFECESGGGALSVRLFGEPLFDLVANWFVWTWGCAKSSDTTLEILDDRLEIRIRDKDPIIFYKDHPFHRQILAKLRELRPFSEAPVWF